MRKLLDFLTMSNVQGDLTGNTVPFFQVLASIFPGSSEKGRDLAGSRKFVKFTVGGSSLT